MPASIRITLKRAPNNAGGAAIDLGAVNCTVRLLDFVAYVSGNGVVIEDSVAFITDELWHGPETVLATVSVSKEQPGDEILDGVLVPVQIEEFLL